jgi:hypothetical protein
VRKARSRKEYIKIGRSDLLLISRNLRGKERPVQGLRLFPWMMRAAKEGAIVMEDTYTVFGRNLGGFI